MGRTVLGPLPGDFPRRLFRNACLEVSRIATDGWSSLDLDPLERVGDPWIQTGHPTLLLSMHQGNWEWLAGVLFHLRKDTIGVARSAHHPLGQRILRWARAYHRTPVHYDGDGYRLARRTLSRGGLVAFLPDQRPPSGGVPGQWLGQATLVSPLPLLWTRDLEVDLWVGQLNPVGEFRYRLELRRYPPSALATWDQVLDANILPSIETSPAHHFGFFHRRLVPRGTLVGAQSP